MAFGQSSGPSATSRQVRELLALLQAAGHEGFRDARGPMSFTQRQAGGKFTRDEAEMLIAHLEEAAGGDGGTAGTSRVAEPAPRLSQDEQTLRRLTTEQLIGELHRRRRVVLET